MIKRETYQQKLNWNKCRTKDLEEAIEVLVPDHIYKNLKSKTRETEILDWRNIAMFCFWLNGETTTEVANRYKRNHATFLNAFKHLDAEIEGFDKQQTYMRRIRKINSMAFVDYDSLDAMYERMEFDTVTVYYNIDYVPIQDWHEIKIVNVSAYVEELFIHDGSQNINIECYNETILIESIKRKLKIDRYDS